MQQDAKRHANIIVHIPLEEEFNEFIEIFPTRENVTKNNILSYLVHSPAGLEILVALQPKQGRTAAMNTCLSILERFSCDLYVCLGIAASFSKDLNLGDVCYTGNMIDISDNSKIKDSSDESGVEISFAPEQYETKMEITSSLGFVRTMTELKSIREQWSAQQFEFAQLHQPDEVPGRNGNKEKIGAPKCLNGFIVCGSVSESTRYQDKIKGITRKILAIETESGVIFELCKAKSIEAVAIRGISDYGDPLKGVLEVESSDSVRKIAARNAVTFLRMQLENSVFISAITGLAELKSEGSFEFVAKEKKSIPIIINILGKSIDSSLRELSPQYRTKPSGFHLPTPRIRPVQQVVSDPTRRPSAIEVNDAVVSRPRILIHVPRNYPDPALAYVIANSLLMVDIGDKKAIPIVIKGDLIAPPSRGLLSLSSVDFPIDFQEQGGEIVFIIDSPNLESKTKRNFLISQMKEFKDCRFVLLTRDDPVFVEESDIRRDASFDIFDLCNVSFAEMAIFLERGFDMPPPEAEVVALKLRTIFDQFSLPAHPSFFAGIPPEMLSALLSANRRSELIQLAVSGFLTFVVAEDRESVRLSRTKREAFLRHLAKLITVERRTFYQADLVQLAEEMSAEYDYGLSALSFVNGFVSSGLIHFEDSRAKITLPFMHSYLLALELISDESAALSYFDPSDDDFDMMTFDLYCEMGPSQSIIRRSIESLDSAVETCNAAYPVNILLENRVHPILLSQPSKIIALSNRIAAAKGSLDSGESQRADKVRILDIADRVNESLSESTGYDISEQNERTDEEKILANILQSWAIACILLGSGAESIKGDDRMRLAASIIRGSSATVNAWTTMFSQFNYDSVRENIIGDDDFRRDLDIEDDKDFEKMVASMVDFLEFMSLSQPLEIVINRLLDHAQHKIISNSITRTNAANPLDGILRALWLSNINQNDSDDSLKIAVAALPDGHFLRSTLTSIVIERVKWHLSNKHYRYLLLDAVEKVIKPVNPSLDKGELRRFVDNRIVDIKSIDEN